MPIIPIVRYMILCEDVGFAPDAARRVNILGLLTNINSIDESKAAYPLLYPELCVFLAVTEARGSASVQIICVLDETGHRVFGTPRHTISFGDDPLEVVAIPFRIRDCLFPHEGLYSFQFWYNDQMIEERPLRMR
jgi:hypothetical protein